MMLGKIFSLTIIAYITSLCLSRPAWDVSSVVEVLILFITAVLIFLPQVVKSEVVPDEFRTLRCVKFSRKFSRLVFFYF